jgi:hypothetical protein
MESQRNWIAATLCWFFALFNVERIFPHVDIASFVYVLATVAGLSMLTLPMLRRERFAVTAVGFGLIWIVGKCMLGADINLAVLPIVLTEAFALTFSQYLCLRIAQNMEEFETKSTQMLDILRATSVPNLHDTESVFLEEIRRARRHERPLTFVSLTPGEATSEALSELVQHLTNSLSREYMIGCLSRVLSTTTKSHDLTVRVGNRFLMLLPETDVKQARAMSRRIRPDIFEQLGVTVNADTYAFGVDEVTLTGVLNRMGMQPVDNAAAQADIFELRPSKPDARRLVATAADDASPAEAWRR